MVGTTTDGKGRVFLVDQGAFVCYGEIVPHLTCSHENMDFNTKSCEDCGETYEEIRDRIPRPKFLPGDVIYTDELDGEVVRSMQRLRDGILDTLKYQTGYGRLVQGE